MPGSDDNLRLEIGHVLFIDIVGYSKLLNEEQKERLNQLTEIVLATTPVREAKDEQLVRLPTGDGMALVFHHSTEEPARCALEIAEALQKHPELPVRMGIHSGPVNKVTDVSGRTNLAGPANPVIFSTSSATKPNFHRDCRNPPPHNVSVSVRVLFLVFGSTTPLGGVTLAVFEIVPLAELSIFPVILYVILPPAGMSTVSFMLPLPLAVKPEAPVVELAV